MHKENTTCAKRKTYTQKEKHSIYTHTHREKCKHRRKTEREGNTGYTQRVRDTHTHMFVYITVCLKTLNFYSPLNWILLFCSMHKYSLWGYRLAIEGALDNKETVNSTQKSKFGITNLYVIHRKGKADDFQVLNFPDAPLEM